MTQDPFAPPPPPPPGHNPASNPPPGYPYRIVAPPATNGMAIAALVTALFLPILGIIFGHIALGQIKRTGDQGKGLAIAGLIIGYLWTAAMVILGIVFVSAIASVNAALESDRWPASTTASTTWSTPSYTTTTPRYTSTTQNYSPGTVSAAEAQSTSNAIRNARVGDCLDRVVGGTNSDGTTSVRVTEVPCSSSQATDDVVARVFDTDDCSGEWVRTTEPTVVLCLRER